MRRDDELPPPRAMVPEKMQLIHPLQNRRWQVAIYYLPTVRYAECTPEADILQHPRCFGLKTQKQPYLFPDVMGAMTALKAPAEKQAAAFPFLT